MSDLLATQGDALSDLPSEGAGSKFAWALFAAIGAFVAVDVIHDASLGAEVEHVLVEGLLMVLALWGTVIFWRRWLGERALTALALARARGEIATWQGEAERWRAEAREVMRGLSQAIDVQFERWKLSPAETEVALLLLKGLSHKEIAAVRSTSERTVRQQAAAVYRKGTLSGRAELSAFFLEDPLVLDEAPAE